MSWSSGPTGFALRVREALVESASSRLGLRHRIRFIQQCVWRTFCQTTTDLPLILRQSCCGISSGSAANDARHIAWGANSYPGRVPVFGPIAVSEICIRAVKCSSSPQKARDSIQPLCTAMILLGTLRFGFFFCHITTSTRYSMLFDYRWSVWLRNMISRLGRLSMSHAAARTRGVIKLHAAGSYVIIMLVALASSLPLVFLPCPALPWRQTLFFETSQRELPSFRVSSLYQYSQFRTSYYATQVVSGSRCHA